MTSKCPLCLSATVHVPESLEEGTAEYWICAATCGFRSESSDPGDWVIASVQVVMDRAISQIDKLVHNALRLEQLARELKKTEAIKEAVMLAKAGPCDKPVCSLAPIIKEFYVAEEIKHTARTLRKDAEAVVNTVKANMLRDS